MCSAARNARRLQSGRINANQVGLYGVTRNSPAFNGRLECLGRIPRDQIRFVIHRLSLGKWSGRLTRGVTPTTVSPLLRANSVAIANAHLHPVTRNRNARRPAPTREGAYGQKRPYVKRTRRPTEEWIPISVPSIIDLETFHQLWEEVSTRLQDPDLVLEAYRE
jgi:hypothetical protein